jgi:hypothetical protein
MARSIEHLCISGIDDSFNEMSFVAAYKMAAQIGWMADRSLGFKCYGEDGWMLPACFVKQESEANHA